MTRQRRNAERHGELLPASRHDGTGREDGTKESGKREAGRDERRDDKKNGPPLLKERRSENGAKYEIGRYAANYSTSELESESSGTRGKSRIRAR